MVAATAKLVGKEKTAPPSTNKSTDAYQAVMTMDNMIWKLPNVFAIVIGVDQIVLDLFVQLIVVLMVVAILEDVDVIQVGLANDVNFYHVIQGVQNMGNVKMAHVYVLKDGMEDTALFLVVKMAVPDTDNVL